jgi:SAM-dependent methyltransferase
MENEKSMHDPSGANCFAPSAISPRFDGIAPFAWANHLRTAAVLRFYDRVDEGRYRFDRIECYCGHDEVVPVTMLDQFNLPSFTSICNKCGFIYNKYQMKLDSLSKFYNDDYREIFNAELFEGENSIPDETLHSSLVPLRFAIHALGEETILALGSVGEIGCDAGQNLAPFRDRGLPVFGTDYDMRRVESGRRVFGLDGLSHGGVEDFADRVGAVDLLILNHVLEHFRDVHTTAGALASCVREGGWLMVSVPSYESFLAPADRDPRGFIQLPHNSYFTLESLDDVLGLHGSLSTNMSLPASRGSDGEVRQSFDDLARFRYPTYVLLGQPGSCSAVPFGCEGGCRLNAQ